MTITLRSFGLGVRTCRQVLAPARIAPAAVTRRSYADAANAPRLRVQEYEYEEEDDEDRPWKFDDISSLAHGELEQHREARHYARIAAYEMPRLFQLARDFVPPTGEDLLRFRYTTYLGENHPAESKVVVEFAPHTIPGLEPLALQKMIKLAGVRYNPIKKIIKMSCESYEHQAQNKRHLQRVINKLIETSKDLEGETFENVPFDFRHYKYRPKPLRIPKKWLQTAKEKETARLAKTPSYVRKA